MLPKLKDIKASLSKEELEQDLFYAEILLNRRRNVGDKKGFDEIMKIVKALKSRINDLGPSDERIAEIAAIRAKHGNTIEAIKLMLKLY